MFLSPLERFLVFALLVLAFPCAALDLLLTLPHNLGLKSHISEVDTTSSQFGGSV